MLKGKKLKYKNFIKKAGITGIAIILIVGALIPSVNSQIGKKSNMIIEKPRLIEKESYKRGYTHNLLVLNGILDNVYLTNGEHFYYGNVNYENFSGDLYVIDDVSIDPNYVWIAWIINPMFVDNTYGNGTVPQYVNKNGHPCGHNFGDLKGSDRQEIKLYDTNSNLVFYAKMDLIHSVSSAPSGYGVPPWGDGDSKVYYGDSSKVEYETSTAFDVNYYYNTPPYNVLQDSPTLGDENYTLYPGYEEWEHRLIYELQVDRSLFGGSTIDVSATEFLNIHASPNRIGPHSIPLYPICYSIGDYVWNDEDEDGIQDPDETGIDGITVELYTCNDEFIASTITSGGGIYEFSAFPTGSYYVKFIAPSGYEFTLQDVGSDDTIDSDADPNTGETVCIDFAGTSNEDDTWDAGMYTTGYILTINIDGNGTVTKNPDQTTYTYGTIVELTANPDSGWSFDHWSGDLTGSNNPETITMNSDKTVTAHFTICEYTLTIIIDGSGTVTKNPDQTTYTHGTVVELTANPDTGWTFDHWSGDLTGSNNPETITMNSDKTVTAHFTICEYTLTIIIDGECGWVNKYPDYPTYPHGTVVMLTAETISCFSFTHWSGDLSGSNNPEYITMDSNKTVTAHFTINFYTLDIIIDGNGYVIKDPDLDEYHCGANVTLTAVPDSGWAFSYWSGDLSGCNNPTYIIMYGGDKTVTVHFTTGEYTLDINIDGNGYVIKDPDHATYPYDTTVELTAVPDSGWVFDHWSGDLTGGNNPETIFMDDNKTVTAHFSIAEPPERPSIDGPTNGKVGVEYKYTFATIDPYESDIYYYIEWGDGDFEDWFGPYSSGEEVTLSHAWSEEETYTIQAKARNIYGVESDWGTLEVTMPLNQQSTMILDPGGIRGPIWGTIRDYQFTGPYNDHLELDAIRVRYFGIGYAFNSGFYPRLYRDRQVTFSYPSFKGIITSNFIIGIISGLPGE